MNVLLSILSGLLLAAAEAEADAVRFRELLDHAEARRADAHLNAAAVSYLKAHRLVREVCGEDSVEEARILLGLGHCLPCRNETKEALVHLRRAVAIAGKRTGTDSRLSHDGLRQLVYLLHLSRRYREVLPLARRSLALAKIHETPESDVLHCARLWLGRAELECGRPWDAERLYRKEIRGPRAAEAWAGIGRVRIALRRLDEAEMYLRKAIDLRSGHFWEYGTLLADIVEKRGRKAEAAAMRKRASDVWRQVG